MIAAVKGEKSDLKIKMAANVAHSMPEKLLF